MGVYAVDYITKAVNNSNYASKVVSDVSKANLSPIPSVSSVSTVSTVATEASSAFSLGSVLNIGGKVFTRANVALSLFGLVKGGYDNLMEYYNSPEYQNLSEDEKKVVEEVKAMADTTQFQQQKTDALKEDTQAIADSVTYTQGQTLPNVLSQNAKALTQSLNFLTSTLSEQFGLLNNYMMGNLILQQQFLDIKTQESGLKIDSMEYNRTSQTVKDWDENILADISPREARLVKDATMAIKTTDENNLELDTDDIDIVLPIDISSINGFTGCDSVYQALIDKYSSGGVS